MRGAIAVVALGFGFGLAFGQVADQSPATSSTAPAVAEGQAKASEDAGATHSGTTASLVISTRFEGRKVFGESFAAYVEVTNSTNKPITLKKVGVEGSGALYGIYPSCEIVAASDTTLQPGTKVSGTCQVERKRQTDRNGETLNTLVPIDPALYLTRLQGTFVVVSATWEGGPPISQLLPITLTQPEWLVALGAMVGVSLLMVFSVSHRLLNGAGMRHGPAAGRLGTLRLEYLPKGGGGSSESTTPGSRSSRGPSAFKLAGAITLEVLLSLLQGGAVALILIVFSRTSVDLHAPISIQVEDFWGGVLVGIFSVPLADAIAQRLVGTPSANS